MYLFWRGWDINFWLLLWAVLGIILFHAAGNLLSDYYDFKKGIDAPDTYGSKTLTDGLLQPKQVLIFGCVMLLIAILNGLGIAAVAGWWLLLFGGLGALFTLLYPWMKAHALGDFCIFLEYGIIPALGTAYTITGGMTSLSLWTDALWAVPAFVTITIAVLHINNTRDVTTDRRAGIRTFAMLIGKEASIVTYILEINLPVIWVLASAFSGRMSWWALLVLATMALSMPLGKQAVTLEKDDNAVNRLDEKTAQLQLLNGLILVVVFLVTGIIGRL